LGAISEHAVTASGVEERLVPLEHRVGQFGRGCPGAAVEEPVSMGLKPHPAPRRCIERLPDDHRNSRVDGRHQNATLKDRSDGDNGYETAKRGRPSGEIVGTQAGWQPCLSSIHPVDWDSAAIGRRDRITSLPVANRAAPRLRQALERVDLPSLFRQARAPRSAPLRPGLGLGPSRDQGGRPPVAGTRGFREFG